MKGERGGEAGEEIRGGGQQEEGAAPPGGGSALLSSPLGPRVLSWLGNFPPSTWLCLSALGSSWCHFYSSTFKVCV